MFKLIITFYFMLSGCATGKKGVNEQKVALPIVPMGFAKPNDSSLPQYPDPRIKIAAMAGRVVLKSQMPRPLSGVTVGIFQKKGDEWKSITSFVSDTDGSFRVLHGLEPGHYQLRVQSPKFEGQQDIELEAPLDQILFEVNEKPKK